MNTTLVLERSPLEGTLNILRFNWPRYALALAAVTLGTGLLLAVPVPRPLRVVLGLGIALGTWWALGSVVVSYWVYDRSGMYEWTWLGSFLPRPPRRWVNVHCGFDETSPALERVFPGARGEVLDLYDPRVMTEGSIRRARRHMRGDRDARGAGLRALPLIPARSFDAAFCLLAAHELRLPQQRAMLFRELHRLVRPEGHVVVVEHLRDPANFVAFGPGFLHFHPRRLWRGLALDHGFVLDREMSLTPFVRAFLLRRVP